MAPVALVVVASTSGVIGLLFNGYILLVLVANSQLRSANNLLLLHLGLVDSVFCLQLLTTAALHSGWLREEPVLCKIQGFIWTTILPVLVWTLAGLNCDRYCAIATPLHYSRLVHTRRVLVFFGLVWLLGIVLACPPLFRVNPYSYREASGGCSADFTDADSGWWFGCVYASASLLLPAALMIYFNVRVFLIARFQQHRIVSALYEITLQAHATITHQRHPPCGSGDMHKFRGRGAVLTLLQLVGSLLVLYAPYFGVLLSEATSKERHPDVLVTVVTALVTCSPPTHGFVYGIKSRVLRKTLKGFLRRQLYQSEVNSEIQRQASRRASVQQGRLSPDGTTGTGTGPGTVSSRTPPETVPRRTIQRRMSEILNISPKVTPHRRLSEFVMPAPLASSAASVGTTSREVMLVAQPEVPPPPSSSSSRPSSAQDVRPSVVVVVVVDEDGGCGGGGVVTTKALDSVVDEDGGVKVATPRTGLRNNSTSVRFSLEEKLPCCAENSV